MVSPKRIAVIPARAGSKRLPGKNVIEFGGKPMIAWTIEAALESGLFDRVFVSTNDTAVADAAAKYGVPVPFFRDAAFDDRATASEATLAALTQIKTREGAAYDEVAQLLPNCPLRTAATIRAAFAAFEKSDAPAQISAFRFGWMNPWWAFKKGPKNRAEFLFKDAVTKRSQDLGDLYCPTGAVWIAKTSALERARSFYTPETAFFEIDWKEAVDVDDAADLEMAAAVLAGTCAK